jgi:hypothetical protein
MRDKKVFDTVFSLLNRFVNSKGNIMEEKEKKDLLKMLSTRGANHILEIQRCMVLLNSSKQMNS